MVVEPEDPAIRPELLQEFGQKIQEERRRKTGRKVYIVQFYDTRRTWYARFTKQMTPCTYSPNRPSTQGGCGTDRYGASSRGQE